MKTLKLTTTLLLLLFVFSCGKKDGKNTTTANKKTAPEYTYILDDLLIYDSYEALREAGFRAVKGTSRNNDVITGYYATINTANKDQIFWNWTNDQYNQLISVSVKVKKGTTTQWKTKDGYTPNTSFKDFIALNKKPLLINKFGFNEATTDWNGGDLANSKIRISIKQTNDQKPAALMRFKDTPVLSDNPYASRYEYYCSSLSLLK